MQIGLGARKLEQSKQHRQAASDIKDKLLQPVRDILQRPFTPPESRLTGHFAKGVGENAIETAKLVVDMPVIAAKFIGKSIHSLATCEDKLGVGEKAVEASEAFKVFFAEFKHEWENPEEYQARLKEARAYRDHLDCAERALNAEEYHTRKAHNEGYWSGEALQAAFGAKAIEGGAKLAKVAAQSARAAKHVKKASAAVKVSPAAAKTVPAAARSSEAVEDIGKIAKREEGVEVAEAAVHAEKDAVGVPEQIKGVVKVTQQVGVTAKTPTAVDKATKRSKGAGEAFPQLLKAQCAYFGKLENINKFEKFIFNANTLTESKGILSGLGTTPASAINSAIYHPSAAEQGAAVFRSIAQGHMFRDGNKRTAATFWREFMRSHEARCTLRDGQLLDIAQKVAEKKLIDTFHIAEALLE